MNQDDLDYVLEVLEGEGEGAARVEIVKLVNAQVAEKTSAVIVEVLLCIIDSKNPRYESDVLGYATRLRLRDGWTISTLAEKYGVSKTKACEDVRKMCTKFGLPIEGLLRSGDEKMEGYQTSNKRNLCRQKS